jgi:hypothetical protein
MSLAKRLDALRERAQRDVLTYDDDALLSSRATSIPTEVAERHYLAPVRLRGVMFDTPRSTRLGVAGDPGQEAPGGQLVVVPGTRVNLFVTVDGAESLAFLHEDDDDLAQAHIEVDPGERRVVVGYLAEHPDAAQANQFFERSVRYIEDEVKRANEVVQEFNDSLVPALNDALERARQWAKERRDFANKLTPPRLQEGVWSRG